MDDDDAEHVRLSSYIDAVYTASDVELATRFLAAYIKATARTPSRQALGVASRIYVKDIARFPGSDWLRLRYATFLSPMAASSTPRAAPSAATSPPATLLPPPPLAQRWRIGCTGTAAGSRPPTCTAAASSGGLSWLPLR